MGFGMNGIRGLVFHSRFDYIKKHFEPATLKALADQLSSQTRHFIFDQVFPVNNYPFQYLEELDTQLANISSQPDAQLFSEIGQEFARIILDRYFFNYVEAREPARFLAQFEKLYPELWGLGEIRVELENDHRAQITFEYEEPVHPPYQIFIEAFLKTAIEICGGKGVKINPISQPAPNNGHYAYILEWEKEK